MDRGGSHTALSAPAGINTHSAMVPSFRLAEQTAKTRALKAENDVLKARVADLEQALKANREEWVFRRGKRAS
jgi:cell division protein FtsB